MLMGGRLWPRQGDLAKKCGKGAKPHPANPLIRTTEARNRPEVDPGFGPSGEVGKGPVGCETAPMTTLGKRVPWFDNSPRSLDLDRFAHHERRKSPSRRWRSRRRWPLWSGVARAPEPELGSPWACKRPLLENRAGVRFAGRPGRGEPGAKVSRVEPGRSFDRRGRSAGSCDNWLLGSPKDQPGFQIPRRHPWPPLLRLEQAYRYALENHLHRNERLGLSVVISETWHKNRLSPRGQAARIG